MNSHLLLKLFSSWELILACVFIIFLLPLVFFLTSRRPRRLSRGPALKARPKPVRPAASRPAKEAAEKEGQDEVEYRERR